MQWLLMVGLLLQLIILVLLMFLLLRSGQATTQVSQLEKWLERVERGVAAESLAVRQEQSGSSHTLRHELQTALQSQAQTNLQTLSQISRQQREVLEQLVTQQEQMRKSVEQKLTVLQEDNSRKLEQMRGTVEEKLQATLEQRLGESFKQVSERLEQVHRGLGEMQSLASGVGDLKKVLVNVKARGTLGEIQLGTLLEQIFSAEQYEANVMLDSGNRDLVEFAVRLPAKEEERGFIYLPIDAKFPTEDYQRLLQAQEAGEREAEAEAAKMLERRIRQEAKKISEKYIRPPLTTDFAVLFLPFEGLYAEVLRRPGLWELLQREHRVVLTGPSTLAALLNSLQMGFRTLAIQKRSSEVWQVLGAVKAKFGEFSQLLAKAQKKIEEAGKSIETAGASTRLIEKKLANVQMLEGGSSRAEELAIPAEATPQEDADD